MSLLLDALKKAELAKQQQAAQQGGRGDDTTLPMTRTGDSLQGAPSIEPMMTRDRLPDIDAPLEMIPDQLPSGEPTRNTALDFSLTDTTIPSRSNASGRASAAAQNAGTRTAHRGEDAGARAASPTSRPWSADVPNDRDAARRLLSNKGADFNPRRPFYIALGILAGVAVGAVGFFWWELQPRSSFSSVASSGARPPSKAATQPAPAVGSSQVAQLPVPASSEQSASLLSQPLQPIPNSPVAPPSIGVKGPAPATQEPRAAPAAPANAMAPATPPRPRMSAAVPTPPDAVRIAARPAERTTRSIAAADPSRVEPVPRRDTVIRPDTPAEAAPIAITRAPAKLDPTIEEAYGAFQRGENDKARQLYLRAAQSDPFNRDVQLGLAAIDLRSQNLTSAEGRYLKLLELDPRDSHALAGIVAIRGAGDPVQAESRVKTFLTHQPDASMLHFALGNQYAAQARWGEAQQAYFRAFAGDPENPDFAFNLAVSLDHIRQERAALDYYERALRLANGRQVGFDRTGASTRIQELQR